MLLNIIRSINSNINNELLSSIIHYLKKQIIWKKKENFSILDPYLAKSLSLWTNTEILDIAYMNGLYNHI